VQALLRDITEESPDMIRELMENESGVVELEKEMTNGNTGSDND